MSKKTTFERLAGAVGLAFLDVGARNGVSNDLAPLGRGVRYTGLEPDIEECSILNSAADKPSNVEYVPLALSGCQKHFMLKLYRQRGCSSALNARKEYAEKFSRGDYFAVDGEVVVFGERLDDVIAEKKIVSPAFMKIDVQGMEEEIFQGAPAALSSSLVGIRTEVSFVRLYENQPLFAEIDQALRPYGFVLMSFIEMHEWRRSTKTKFPKLSSGRVQYSRGQLVHADVLYMLDPDLLPSGTEEEIQRLVRLGLVAICYEQLDHAQVAFGKRAVREYCELQVGEDPLEMIAYHSKKLARRKIARRLFALASAGALR